MFDRITVEPGKLGGQPCIRGQRFTVSHLVRLVADGWGPEQIQEDVPFIEAEDTCTRHCSTQPRRLSAQSLRLAGRTSAFVAFRFAEGSGRMRAGTERAG